MALAKRRELHRELFSFANKKCRKTMNPMPFGKWEMVNYKPRLFC